MRNDGDGNKKVHKRANGTVSASKTLQPRTNVARQPAPIRDDQSEQTRKKKKMRQKHPGCLGRGSNPATTPSHRARWGALTITRKKTMEGPTDRRKSGGEVPPSVKKNPAKGNG